MIRRKNKKVVATPDNSLKTTHWNGFYVVLASLLGGGGLVMALLQYCNSSSKTATISQKDTLQHLPSVIYQKKDSPRTGPSREVSQVQQLSEKKEEQNSTTISSQQTNKVKIENSEISGPVVHQGNVIVEKGAVYVSKNEGSINVTNQNSYCIPDISIFRQNLNQEVEEILNYSGEPKIVSMPNGVERVYRTEIDLKYQCDGRSGASFQISWPRNDIVYAEFDCRNSRGCILKRNPNGPILKTRGFAESLIDVEENIYTLVVYTINKVNLSELKYNGK